MSAEAIANMLQMIDSAGKSPAILIITTNVAEGYFTLPPIDGEPSPDPLPVGNTHLPGPAGGGNYVDYGGVMGSGDYGNSSPDGHGEFWSCSFLSVLTALAGNSGYGGLQDGLAFFCYVYQH